MLRIVDPVDKGEFFREVTLRICGTLDIDQALEEAFSYVRRHVPAETMGLGYTDLTTGEIRVVAKVAAEGGQFVWDVGQPSIPLRGEGRQYVEEEGRRAPDTLLVNRPDDQPPGLIHLFPELARSSAVFLRLAIHDEEEGALLISARGADRYSNQHRQLLESIREPVTIAMVNARRYQELARLKQQLQDDHRALAEDVKRAVGAQVVGAEFGLRAVMEQVRKIASASSPTLLLGETGTGKEVIANAIHMASPRSSGPMISMQCGAIPETLLDSELFGHEKGAFTGASERKRGRFERAHGGTLFLDEIGELSPEAQVKLLRVLQERRFERVGGTRTLEVDVRVIAATHRDLASMVRDGSFREDLWYRLNVLPIRIPPLRLRREDVPSLVRHFVERKARELNLQSVPFVTGADLERLQRYDWPGNVRELQNVVERALILSSGGTLEFPPLESASSSAPAPASGRTGRVRTLDEATAVHIRSVLETTRWKVSGPGGAAELLGLNPSTLRFRMQKLGIRR